MIIPSGKKGILSEMTFSSDLLPHHSTITEFTRQLTVILSRDVNKYFFMRDQKNNQKSLQYLCELEEWSWIFSEIFNIKHCLRIWKVWEVYCKASINAISLIPFHQFIREYIKHDKISTLQIMQPSSSATSLMLFRLNNSFLQISYLTPFTISQETFSDNQILPIPFPNYSYL